ncbi:MAG: hypothetical protein GFH27_549325n41 [Chloroflexi bacterium AL-W]|nr:hypothetical protein [Chloroflexi bacterium AL-N1]NOK70109.1 hypothetical protein [Chloroflexi bacterium AL-N10]NOK77879.1 hypothetical protein [Chloroflexi bacterium AL-N5]NOK84888.1 hypothetical protein [Chloroflexi bacterium AL-W]NOK91867.1 hypothetical protein [Chloroflexi bacterium AL-N15]
MSAMGDIADNITINIDRPTLGNTVDVVCFQYLCNIVSDLTGRSPIIAASRARGYDAMNAAGFLGITHDGLVRCERILYLDLRAHACVLFTT